MCVETDALLRVGPFIIVRRYNYGVPLAAFHTFDEGKRRGLDGGRGVPLLGYETWCDECKDDPAAAAVIALNRRKPEHPSPILPHSTIEQKLSGGPEASPGPVANGEHGAGNGGAPPPAPTPQVEPQPPSPSGEGAPGPANGASAPT